MRRECILQNLFDTLCKQRGKLLQATRQSGRHRSLTQTNRPPRNPGGIQTDTASTHDSQHFDNVFDTSNTSRDVYADRGYPSEGCAALLKDNGFRNQIQRKGKRNKPLSECQQRRNQRIAKTRARVEHVFGVIEQMGGKLLRTIGQARTNFAMTMMAACYKLKRLVYFREAGIEAF